MRTQKKNELTKISTVKTFMMFCVVLYHSCLAYIGDDWGNFTSDYTSQYVRVFCLWLNTFHIQTFTFASGYLFYMRRYDMGKYRNGKADIFHRAKRLLLPYIVISLIWAFPIKSLFYGFSWRLLIRDFVLAIAPAQLWFLPMLFFLYIVFYYGCDLFLKINKFVVILFGVFLIQLFIGKIIPLGVFQISNTVMFSIYYWLGIVFRRESTTEIDGILHRWVKKPLWKQFLINIILYLLYYWGCYKSKNIVFHILAEGILPFISCLGILLIIAISFRLRINIKNKIYRICAVNSMGVFLLHEQILYFLIRIFDDFPMNINVRILLNFLLAMTISLGLSTIIRRSHLGRVILGEEN